MNVIKNLNEINKIIESLKNKNFEEALKKLKKIIIDNSNKNLIYKLFASIYFQKKEWENSIKYYEQILSLENEKFRIYNNIGVALFNLGKINESIVAYKKATKENSNFDLAYNNLGISYSELGAYEEAANHFAHASNLNRNNQSAKNNLINMFLVTKLKNVNKHFLIKINDRIKNINYKINIKKSIKLEHIKNILVESDNIINDSLKEINFNETQIYRKNSTNLDCKRHFKIFNEFNVIPKYCFNCYKIQINLKNVVELIRLFFVFDNLFLEKNNIRKCITEIRQNISGNYKGYIYCDGIEEAKKIFDKISNIMNQIKFNEVKITIKHGCSEFYESYPGYKEINLVGSQPMTYDKEWEKKELVFDNKIPIRSELDKKQIHKSLEGINLSDILIIKNWICYAAIIGDFSYKEIYDKEIKSNFIQSILESQLSFRKKDAL
jgi:tetratricopeptide (TPR) repeat protein